jgi:competence ComEA-like helix-hairpin-helix protein
MPTNSTRKTILSITAKVQNFLGVTRSELIVVTVLLLGLLTGLVFKRFSAKTNLNVQHSEIAHILDSLGNVEVSTFTGTTPDAEPVPALARADTLRTSFSRFPRAPKKEKISAGKININTATMQDLMRLPGVGETTAEKIITLRKERPFSRIEDVMRVKGIGKKKFETMKPFLNL